MGPQTPSVKEMIEDNLVATKDNAAVTAQRDNTRGKKQTKEEAEMAGKSFHKLGRNRRKQTPRRTNRPRPAKPKRWRRSMPTRMQSENENYPKPHQKTAVEVGGCGK
ncbi:unnamed protein product [Ixodes pacificus]